MKNNPAGKWIERCECDDFLRDGKCSHIESHPLHAMLTPSPVSEDWGKEFWREFVNQKEYTGAFRSNMAHLNTKSPTKVMNFIRRSLLSAEAKGVEKGRREVLEAAERMKHRNHPYVPGSDRHHVGADSCPECKDNELLSDLISKFTKK